MKTWQRLTGAWAVVAAMGLVATLFIRETHCRYADKD